MRTNHQMNYYDYAKTLSAEGVMKVLPKGSSTPFPSEFGGTGNGYTKNSEVEVYVGEEFAETYIFGPTYQMQNDEVMVIDTYNFTRNGYVYGILVANILPDVPIKTKCEAPNGEIKYLDGMYDVA